MLEAKTEAPRVISKQQFLILNRSQLNTRICLVWADTVEKLDNFESQLFWQKRNYPHFVCTFTISRF